jgi:hypothetical protein
MLRHPLLPYAALLETLPFFLQFLGLGLADRLGQGLCGSVFGVGEKEAVMYGLVSEYYLYGQVFLVLLALKVTYALGLALLRFMYEKGEPPGFEPLVWGLGAGLSWAFLLAFLLTRTLPLPFPSPLGLAWLSPAPLDPLSLLMVLPELPLLYLLYKLRP